MVSVRSQSLVKLCDYKWSPTYRRIVTANWYWTNTIPKFYMQSNWITDICHYPGFTCSNSTIETPKQWEKSIQDLNDVVLVSSLLTLNRFHIMFWYFSYWFWKSLCRLGCNFSEDGQFLKSRKSHTSHTRCEVKCDAPCKFLEFGVTLTSPNYSQIHFSNVPRLLSIDSFMAPCF